MSRTTRTAFFVGGEPVTQGSMKAIVSKTTGRAMILPDKKAELNSWRDTIGHLARQAGCLAGKGAVYITLDFYMPRPRSVKRALPIVKPDIDKLSRAVLDALTGVAYVDDGQVVSITALKHYADDRGPGVHIELKVVEP